MAERTVVVVGGGLAGVSAALAGAAEGARVTLVAKAPGATALYGGAMEIAPAGGVDGSHPYSRLGFDALRLAAELDEACRFLVAALGREGLELRGGAGETGLYADLRGSAHAAQLVPASVAGGELGRLRGRRVLVVGVPAVAEYDAESTALALRELSGLDARPAECVIDGLAPDASITDLFGRQAPVPRGAADAIAYPPGFTGLPAGGFELLAAAPSPHGWRLQLALERALERAGVRSVRATVDGFDLQGDRLVAARAGTEPIHGDAFVLATGRYIGGGLRRGRALSEPLLDLPVFFDGAPVAQRTTEIRHLEYLSPEPAFRGGVRTDAQLRPVGPDGGAVFSNLRAAGALLAGRDYADGTGFGVPLLTGRLAGRWSARA